MLKVKLIVVGNLKEKYWREASAEYEKRLGRYVDLELVEVKEARMKDKVSDADIASALEKEAEQILKQINATDYVVVLAINGNMLTSEQVAEQVAAWEQNGKRIVFIIGSSHGLAQSVVRRANFKFSFSKMTFPHQMIRIFLLEQIYRGYKILRNETYHK